MPPAASDKPTKTRLDQYLVSLGMFDSRAQAAAAIKAGHVSINGTAARKPAQIVSDEDDIQAAAAHAFVSRGGLKLQAALTHFNYPVAEKTFVDIGASTGGFTDVLLRHGAAYVFAVDVGQAQLHDSLKRDPRVKNMEKTNARYAEAAWFDRPLDGLVCDVSFISVKLALKTALALVEPQGWALMLIKPQFEVGRDHLGKNGVVSDADARAQACADVRDWLAAHPAGWQVDGLIESPITGPQGNIEYLLAARRA